MNDGLKHYLEALMDEKDSRGVLKLIERKLKQDNFLEDHIIFTMNNYENAIKVSFKVTENENNKILLIFINLGDIFPIMKKKVNEIRNNVFSGHHAIKKAIVAVFLKTLKTIRLEGSINDLAIIFHDWPINSSMIQELLPDGLKNNSSYIWIVEPTNLIPCNVEKGFGAFKLRFNANNEDDKNFRDTIKKFRKKLETHFKPHHDMYPLNESSSISRYFLPGVSSVKTYLIKENIVRISYSFTLVERDLKRKLLNKINSLVSELFNKSVHHEIEDELFLDFKKFSIYPGYQEFLESCYHEIFNKYPNLEWSITPSICRLFTSTNFNRPLIIFGPGDPFVSGKLKEHVKIEDINTFFLFLKNVLEKWKTFK
ncbi:MAG: hypothetical protein ACTSVI_12445 [Promethearchaeota archaeon]